MNSWYSVHSGCLSSTSIFKSMTAQKFLWQLLTDDSRGFIFCRSGLKTAGGVLFLVSVTCFLALLSVNSDMIIFHYLFAGFNCVQVSPTVPSVSTVWKVDLSIFFLTLFPLLSSPRVPLFSSSGLSSIRKQGMPWNTAAAASAQIIWSNPRPLWVTQTLKH